MLYLLYHYEWENPSEYKGFIANYSENKNSAEGGVTPTWGEFNNVSAQSSACQCDHYIVGP